MSDMKEVAKPYSALELKTKNEFDQGRLDAAIGRPARSNASTAYLEGHRSEKTERDQLMNKMIDSAHEQLREVL